jgi:hypothetical protein
MLLLMAVLMVPSLSIGEEASVAPAAREGQVIGASEVSVPQVKGRIERKGQAPATQPPELTKLPPEGASRRPVGPTAPETCDPQNATSPACYAATQQTPRAVPSR